MSQEWSEVLLLKRKMDAELFEIIFQETSGCAVMLSGPHLTLLMEGQFLELGCGLTLWLQNQTAYQNPSSRPQCWSSCRISDASNTLPTGGLRNCLIVIIVIVTSQTKTEGTMGTSEAETKM
ncbi:General Transcription Factor Ii-I Repeat Domain-Containing Protein 1 [Manis pentadactyla]|nr:General Transcription Factor Ii-I Repeat Domain-Containing Protein 1 [Manis pentadactyla]